jgi:hypothetical protein
MHELMGGAGSGQDRVSKAGHRVIEFKSFLIDVLNDPTDDWPAPRR